MGRMERPIIEIPAEVKEIVEQAVASGEFVSAGDMEPERCRNGSPQN
jgi:hypothetical protein